MLGRQVAPSGDVTNVVRSECVACSFVSHIGWTVASYLFKRKPSARTRSAYRFTVDMVTMPPTGLALTSESSSEDTTAPPPPPKTRIIKAKYTRYHRDSSDIAEDTYIYIHDGCANQQVSYIDARGIASQWHGDAYLRLQGGQELFHLLFRYDGDLQKELIACDCFKQADGITFLGFDMKHRPIHIKVIEKQEWCFQSRRWKTSE